MINNAIYYLTSTLFITSILMAFFKADSLIPLYVYIIKKLGYKKNDPTYWSQFNRTASSELNKMLVSKGIVIQDRSPFAWTKGEVNNFLKSYASEFCYNLLQCRYCLSYHIVLWINIIFGLILTFGITQYDIKPITFFIAIITQPFVVNWLFTWLDNNSHTMTHNNNNQMPPRR